MAASASLLLATRNPHKLEELGRLLAPAGIEVEPLPAGVPLPPEGGGTFAANALPKALAAATATGGRRRMIVTVVLMATVLGGLAAGPGRSRS